MKKSVISFVIVFACFTVNAQKYEDLAKTPPMGWNSWNKFGCDVNEQLVKEMADAMVSSGMKDAGYEYIVIDDCWQVSRDSAGNIIADPERFPSGIKALAAYIHSKGLKLGIYSDAGGLTCQKRPGSRGYEFQDARKYAQWEVDYLKYDWCNTGKQSAPDSYRIMRDALYKAGRPIVFSICEWGANKPWLWAPEIGHLWRNTEDIMDSRDTLAPWGGMDWKRILDLQVGMEIYSGPGKWNDPDMLEVGNKALPMNECRAHFSLWCLLNAPLMAGNDLRSMNTEIKQILTNKEVIAVNQDPLGKQGVKVKDTGDLEVWAKQLSDGSKAVILFNRGKVDADITVNWLDLGYTNRIKAKIRDLWKHQDLGEFSGEFKAKVPSLDVVMIRVTP